MIGSCLVISERVRERMREREIVICSLSRESAFHSSHSLVEEGRKKRKTVISGWVYWKLSTKQNVMYTVANS